jgi:hypothetical protein
MFVMPFSGPKIKLLWLSALALASAGVFHSCSQAEDVNVVESDFVISGQLYGEGLSLDPSKVQCNIIGLDGLRSKANDLSVNEDGIFKFVVTLDHLHQDFLGSEVLNFTTFAADIPTMDELSNSRHLEQTMAMIRFDCLYNPEDKTFGTVHYHQGMATVAKNSLWKGGFLEVGKIELTPVGMRPISVMNSEREPVADARVTPLLYQNGAVVHVWQAPQFGPVFHLTDATGIVAVFPLPLSEDIGQYQVLVKSPDYCTSSSDPKLFDPQDNAALLVDLDGREHCPASDIPGDMAIQFSDQHASEILDGRLMGYTNTKSINLTILPRNNEMRPLHIRIYSGLEAIEENQLLDAVYYGFSSNLALTLPKEEITNGDSFLIVLDSQLNPSDLAAGFETAVTEIAAQYGVEEVSASAEELTILGPGDRANYLSGFGDQSFSVSYKLCPELGRIALIDETNVATSDFHFVECSAEAVSYPMSGLVITKEPGTGGFRNLQMILQDKFGNQSVLSESAVIYNVYVDYGVPEFLGDSGIVTSLIINNLGSFGVALKTDAKGTDTDEYDFLSDIYLSSSNADQYVLRFNRPGACKLKRQAAEDGARVGDLGHLIKELGIGSNAAEAEAAIPISCGEDIPLQSSSFQVPSDPSAPVTISIQLTDWAQHKSSPYAHKISRCIHGDVNITGTQLCWCDLPGGCTPAP